MNCVRKHNPRKKVVLLLLIIISVFLSGRFMFKNANTLESSPGSLDYESSSAKSGYDDFKRFGLSARGADTSVSTPTPNPLLQSKLVILDPGHGGVDPGTECKSLGLMEKDISLSVCLKLNELLKQEGIDTYMTRSTDSTLKINDRIRTANQMNASLVLSIHCDSFEDSSNHGTTTLYYSSRSHSTGSLSSEDYAKIIQDELTKSIGTNDRGTLRRTDIGILKYTKMPSALVELGFLSNENDASLLMSEDFRDKAAEGLAKGIKKALELVTADEK